MTNPAIRPAHFLKSLLCVAACLCCAPLLLAADSDILQIEEYWELEVGGPDAARSAPQVMMIMSPTAHLDADFFAFAINHWSYPDFAAGGYQLQRWHGEDCLEAHNGARTSPIETDGEVITWVQRLSVNAGQVKFQVVDGNSDSWSQFGGEGFALTVPTELTRLNGYHPANSLQQSGIGYAGNRVSSLVLQKLRWITADGEDHEMVAPIDIHLDLDP